ncbi:MAG TPA: hypothetical protein PLL32_11150 [Anaeromyxobacteraceae bacterium]|nr:hypothetical protein [Anaeromyxobacteraceae bacterium]
MSELHRERDAGVQLSLTLAVVFALTLAGAACFPDRGPVGPVGARVPGAPEEQGFPAPRATASPATDGSQAAMPGAVAVWPPESARGSSGEPSPSTVDPWEQVPLDRDGTGPLGPKSVRRAFFEAMRKPRIPILVCRQEWVAPPGVNYVMMEVELRVRSQEESLVVEDVAFPGGSVGDAGLEHCIAREYRGRRSEAPGIEPGRAFRMLQTIHFVVP